MPGRADRRRGVAGTGEPATSSKRRRVRVLAWSAVLASAAALLMSIAEPVVASASNSAGSQANAKSQANAGSQANWPMYMFNLAKTGYNPSETTITAKTAPSLKLHWVYPTTTGRPLFAQPIEADGHSYWGSLDGYEYASDPATGAVDWQTFVGQLTLPAECTSQEPNPLGVSGTSQLSKMSIDGVMTPVLFVAGGNSTVYALNADTGAIIWQTAVGSDPWDYMFDSPAVWNGNLYIGVSSPSNCPKTTQGQVFKLNAITGAVEASFDVVPSGTQAEPCVGGGVWGSIAIDTKAGTLYVPTGSPDVNNCPGTDKPLTPALLELSASDLSLIGYWQVPVADRIADSDFGNTPTLFTTSTGTAMVAIANKNGVLYAFQRGDLDAGPVWQYTIDDSTEPALAPAAFNGKYIFAAGGTNTINGKSCKGGLYKIDPDTGATVWAICTPGWPNGAVSMAPGLVLVGTGASFELYSAESGKLLYTFADHESKSNFWGSGSISGGQIFYGNKDGKLFVIGT